tara:strand:- start:64 stop:1332 length:1269 start_codon:yes stop_codon:yes gene_type:complete
MVNYYSILIIGENSSKEEIKKAYHKAALKYHPDKNKDDNAEEMFKKVVEAYEVLSDPYKKKKYDNSLKYKLNFDFKLSPEILNFSKYFFSEENINKFTNISSTISKEISNLNLPPYFDTIFNSLTHNFRNNTIKDLVTEYQEFKKFYHINEDKFKQRENREHRENGEHRENRENRENGENRENREHREHREHKKESNSVNKNITFNLLVSLEDIYKKIIKNIAIKMNVKCKNCDGTGLINIVVKNKKKSKNKKKRKKYIDKKICHKCDGLMTEKERNIFTIDCSHDQIIYRNEYYIDEENGHGDLIINIITKPHIIERVRRYDLRIIRNITLYEFYFGGNLKIDHIDGTIIDWDIPKLITDKVCTLISERDIQIPNYGLPIYDNDKNIGRGNLIVKLKLILPNNLDDYENDIKKIFYNNNEP